MKKVKSTCLTPRAGAQPKHGTADANTDQNDANAASAANTAAVLPRQHAERVALNARH